MILLNPVRSAKLKDYPQGHIYQGYGENILLYLRAIGAKGHTGIDIATFDGDEILAAHKATVVEVYNDNNGYGHHVRLVSPKQSDGTYFETIYGHLTSNIPVVVGQEVEAGDVIGYEGNTGFVISGATPYWGNAPDGKGVHLHWGLRILEDVRPNSAQVSYSGGKYSYTIINYTNGLFGYIDPMPYIKTMYDLYKDPLKVSEIYAFGSGYRRHISNYYTFKRGQGKEWAVIEPKDIPFADATVFANTPEAEEICFLPNDLQA